MTTPCAANPAALPASRRSFLAGALAFTLAAAPASAAVVMSEIDRLWPAAERLAKAFSDADREFSAADNEFERRKPARPDLTDLHPLIYAGNDGWSSCLTPAGYTVYYGTAERWRRAVQEVKSPWERKEAAKRLAAAEKYEAEVAALEAELRLDDLEQAHGEAWDASSEIDSAILALPAANLSDVLKKITIAHRRDLLMQSGQRATLGVFADIERLARGGR